MRAILVPLVILAGSVLSLAAEDVIKDKSPDGKFALRMTHGKEGWDTEIIETGDPSSWTDQPLTLSDAELRNPGTR